MAKKNPLSISLAFAILMSVLLHGACQKEDDVSQEDFINYIKGEWHVYLLSYTDVPLYPSSLYGYISFAGDTVIYSVQNEQQYYPFDDSVLCTLPHMEKIRNWTIIENNRELFLETTGICGETENYQIEYSNYHYDSETGHVSENVIIASISLLSQDTTITLNAFKLDSSEKMLFDVITGNAKDSYSLLRGHFVD